MNRYLFLDFDGVLHPVGSPVDRLFCQLEFLESWLRLYSFVFVVISSSWRIPHPLDELREFFSEDLRDRVVGATGLHWRDVHQRTGEMPFEVRHERELEVLAWLQANGAGSDIWMALEDEVSLYRPGNARVVGCDPGTGLTEKTLQLLEPLVRNVEGTPVLDEVRMKGHGPDVVYLDYDGVLHPESVYVNARRGIHLRDAPGRNLFENCQVLIDELQPYPHVRLVLSTSWVRGIGFDRALSRLPVELRARCIGATYHSRFHRPGRDEGVRGINSIPLRGEEVLADVQRRRPRKWLALDDTDEGWPDEARSNLILTHPLYGISAAVIRGALHAELRRFS